MRIFFSHITSREILFNILLDCQRDIFKGRWHIFSEANCIVIKKKKKGSINF